MFQFFRNLFKHEPQPKFKAGEEVRLSCCSLVFSDCDCSICKTRTVKTGTVKAVSVEPAQYWYKVEMQDGTHRTVHESDIEKANKNGKD